MLKINFLLDGILCTKDSVYNKRASFDCLERRSRRRKLRKSLVVVKIRNIWVTSSVAPRQNIRGGLTGKNSTIRRAVFGAQYSARSIRRAVFGVVHSHRLPNNLPYPHLRLHDKHFFIDVKRL